MKITKFRTFSAVIAVLVLALTACPTPDENSTAVTTPQTVATPAAIPAGGEVADNTPIALATATAGAAIYYTQDGTEPTAASTRYSDSAKPTISTGKLILKALAVKDGMNNSAVLTAVYTLTPPNTAAKPTATPAGGEVADNTPIALTTSTAEASIYYTQDGTEPTAASTLYSDSAKPIITAGKLTLKAVAVKSGMNNSAVLTETYTIATVTPAPTADAGQDFTHDIIKDGASITLNGSAQNGTILWACTPPASAKQPAISDTATAQPTVSGFDKLGDYTFTLTVTNGTESKSDTVKVTLVATVTTAVSISATTFASGTSLNFAPTYTSSNTTDFPIASIGNYITYTVTASNGSPNTWNSANGSVTVSNNTAFYDKWTTFTQTFYKNGVVEPVGNRTFEVYSLSLGFSSFGGEDGDWEDTISVPAITGITLAKTLTSGSIPPVVVSFVPLGTFPGATTLNFSPSAELPKGVTYIITNDKTSKTWNDIGTVSASDFVNVNDNVTFTQTFYLNGTEITGAGSKRTVKLDVFTFMGDTDFSFLSDTGSVTLSITGIPPIEE